MTARCIRGLAILLCAGWTGAAFPGADDDAWLEATAARDFRARVGQLAVIYGESRGIDPRGLLVTGRRIGEEIQDCAEVEIVVLDGARELRHERVRACRHAH